MNEQELVQLIRQDLTSNKPLYSLSCYGICQDNLPGTNFISGDLSYEELRFNAFECFKRDGNYSNFWNHVDKLAMEQEEKFRHLYSNPQQMLLSCIERFKQGGKPQALFTRSKLENNPFSSISMGSLDASSDALNPSNNAFNNTVGKMNNAFPNNSISFTSNAFSSGNSNAFGSSNAFSSSNAFQSNHSLSLRPPRTWEYSQEDNALFQAPEFTFGRIPTKPPPSNLS
jgi:hypothetical protein